ncbi:hypothetical protein ACH4ZX_08010 [Streptomyces sp. NPDC020490]|uniref:hypothetical protein n=1 Tax=Streptomyces sp. NPDC020490 TaxID=3365078 RepID=UPI0037AB11DA
MKSLKAAAVVAGTLALAGATAPAYAQDAADVTPTSLNGAVNTLTKGRIDPVDATPLHHRSNALNTENKDSVLHTVRSTTNTLNDKGLLGGLPLGR